MKLKNLFFIFAFCLVATYASGQKFFYFTLNYSTAMPLGETKDFTDSYSWRGISMEGHWEMNDNLSLGYNFGWNVFFNKVSGEFVDDTRTLTGTQLRYVNAFPLYFDVRYHLGTREGTRPYVGVGVGTIRTRQRTDMGIFSVETNTWQFGISPNVGVLIPVGFSSRINVGVQYHYAPKSGDALNHSYMAINLGYVWEN